MFVLPQALAADDPAAADVRALLALIGTAPASSRFLILPLLVPRSGDPVETLRKGVHDLAAAITNYRYLAKQTEKGLDPADDLAALKAKQLLAHVDRLSAFKKDVLDGLLNAALEASA